MIMLIILVVHLFEIIDLLSWIVGCDCHYIFYTLIFTRRFRIATYSHRAVPSPHTHTPTIGWYLSKPHTDTH
jgi:hypothetical protein